MANKKAYATPNVAIEELVKTDVILGSTYDNIGEDEDWTQYLEGGSTL